PKYIYYLFNTINWHRYNEATGVPSLSVKNISSINVCMPNLTEQEKKNNILTNIDNKIQIEKEKLTSLNLIKKGLMQALLTGKKRVKVDEEEVTTSCQV